MDDAMMKMEPLLTFLLLALRELWYRRFEAPQDKLPYEIPNCACTKVDAEGLKGEPHSPAGLRVIGVGDPTCSEISQDAGVVWLQLAVVPATDQRGR